MKRFFWIIVFGLILVACSPQQPTIEPIVNQPVGQNDVPEQTDSALDSAPGELDNTVQRHNDPAVSAPAWFQNELVNAVNGDSFTLSDYYGQVVVAIFVRIDCLECLKQQEEIKSLAGTPGLVMVSLDVNAGDSQDDLKQYAQNYGFDWVFGTDSSDLAREISASYGQQFTDPSSAPILVIDRQGKVTLLPLGFKSADDLKNAIQPLLDAGN